MRKVLFILFLFINLKIFSEDDFLNRTINIPDGIYCLEDIAFLIEEQTAVKIKVSCEGYEFLMNTFNAKNESVSNIFNSISRFAKIELKFDENKPYFWIECLRKIDNNAPKMKFNLENVNIKDFLKLLAEIEGKELDIKNEEAVKKKITIKCKEGITFERISEVLNENYGIKIELGKDKMVIK